VYVRRPSEVTVPIGRYVSRARIWLAVQRERCGCGERSRCGDVLKPVKDLGRSGVAEGGVDVRRRLTECMYETALYRLLN
jgi:hypothetical protein